MALFILWYALLFCCIVTAIVTASGIVTRHRQLASHSRSASHAKCGVLISVQHRCLVPKESHHFLAKEFFLHRFYLYKCRG